MDLKSLIRTIPDFPEEGILFRDITTLLKEPEGLYEAVEQLRDSVKDLAYAEHKGFVPVRKPGKLPAAVYSQEYALEYGVSRLEMHQDALKPGQKVLIVDDLLATGGTAQAIATMVEKAGCQVAGFTFLIELADLGGREKLKNYSVRSVLSY